MMTMTPSEAASHDSGEFSGSLENATQRGEGELHIDEDQLARHTAIAQDLITAALETDFSNLQLLIGIRNAATLTRAAMGKIAAELTFSDMRRSEERQYIANRVGDVLGSVVAAVHAIRAWISVTANGGDVPKEIVVDASGFRDATVPEALENELIGELFNRYFIGPIKADGAAAAPAMIAADLNGLMSSAKNSRSTVRRAPHRRETAE